MSNFRKVNDDILREWLNYREETELGYLDGVTSNVQTQLNGKAASSHSHDGTYTRIYNLGIQAFGGNQNGITTAQFLTLLNGYGAFSDKSWITRGSWSYASNQYIKDTGCGNIHLAGCTVEVMGTSTTNCTIRIHTPTTSSSGVSNGDFIYINNGPEYTPGWRRLYSTKYKPTAADIGAAGISYSDERAKQVDFTINYATSRQVVIVNENSNITSPSDIYNKKIAVQLGSVADSYVTKNFTDATIVRQKKYI